MTVKSSQKQSIVYVNSILGGLDEPDIQQKLFFAKLSKPKSLVFAAHKIKNVRSAELTLPLVDEKFMLNKANEEDLIPLSISFPDKAPHLVLDDESAENELLLHFLNSAEFQSVVKKYNRILGRNFLIFSSDLPNIQLNITNFVKFDFAEQTELFRINHNKVLFNQNRLESLLLNDEADTAQLLLRSYLAFLLLAQLLKIHAALRIDLKLADYFQFKQQFNYAGNPTDDFSFDLMVDKILTQENLKDLIKDISSSYFTIREQSVLITRYKDADTGKLLPEHEFTSFSLKNPLETYFINNQGRRSKTSFAWDFINNNYELLLEDKNYGNTTMILAHRIEIRVENYEVSLVENFEGLDEDAFEEFLSQAQQQSISIQKNYQVDLVTDSIVADSIVYYTDSDKIILLDDGNFRLKPMIPPEFEDYRLISFSYDHRIFNVNNDRPLEMKCHLIYEMKPSQIVLKFVDLDADQSVLHTQIMEEKPLSQRDISLNFSENYLPSSDKETLKLVFPAKAGSQDEITIGLKHKTEKSSKEATFTVNYEGLPDPHPYFRTIPYEVSKDLVTGAVTASSDEATIVFSPPYVKGYELSDRSLHTISHDFAANGFKDAEYNLQYQQVTIEIPVRIIELKSDTVLQTFFLKGHQGDLVEPNWEIPEGCEYISSNMPDDFRFDVDKDQALDFFVRQT
ncbi:MAG: hypothetical protein LBV19_05535 [Streptococcaceae bacterium]|nr:hypothetical protein [Streptococcaceae bacterium]